MSKFELIKYPAPVLRKPTETIKEIDAELIQTADEMLTLMYEKNGVGLAGPQAGISKRIAVIDLREDHHPVYVLINPRVVKREGAVETEEGCLSLPEIFTDVKRAERVKVEYIDREGETRSIEAEGLFARALQHEIDHLNGVLFIDRIGETRRRLLAAQLRALTEEFEGKNGKHAH